MSDMDILELEHFMSENDHSRACDGDDGSGLVNYDYSVTGAPMPTTSFSSLSSPGRGMNNVHFDTTYTSGGRTDGVGARNSNSNSNSTNALAVVSSRRAEEDDDADIKSAAAQPLRSTMNPTFSSLADGLSSNSSSRVTGTNNRYGNTVCNFKLATCNFTL
jgi:hypothetical protein